jgi:hypothetical protein
VHSASERVTAWDVSNLIEQKFKFCGALNIGSQNTSMSLGWLVDSYRTTLLDPANDAEIFSELVQNLKKGSCTKALFSGTGLKPDFQFVIEKGLLLRVSLHEPFLFS